MPCCHVCGAASFDLLVPAGRLQIECQWREEFIDRRLARRASPTERKDLTDFHHGADADILACTSCGLLYRDEHQRPQAETYSDDKYDPGVIDNMYPDYLRAFRERAHPFRGLLPGGATVLEVGSHYGAFLQVAGEWGWNALAGC